MFLTLMLVMTMGSYHVFAQSVTITLMPGWNWISVPLMDTLDFETALGSFTPVAGDMIKSQWSNASYKNGQWRGPISQFYPGYGYMYKSNRPMPVTVTFTAQQPAPQVIVTTTEPTDITTNSAICGGSVSSSNGDYVSVILRGICWSTNPNPTFNDNYIEVGNGLGNFSVPMIELTPGTIYYVCAFALVNNETYYGEQMIFITWDSILTLTTEDVIGIQGTTAFCGGDIIYDGEIIARGVCWSTSPNPTIADSHTTNGSGIGRFRSSITGLTVSTTYYVRAYANAVAGTAYGDEKIFTTLPNDISHDYVDLGLPSGTLWATCNVGSDMPDGHGTHFAWGETQPKTTYNWSTYQYCSGSDTTLTKYCNNSDYGYNGFTDNLTTLLPEDDAATANWGNGWRMPSYEEWQELFDNTICTWTANGRLFTASNGNSLFLPAAGYYLDDRSYFAGSYGRYRSSSLNVDSPNGAWHIFFGSEGYDMYSGGRSSGYSVRPVRSVE